MLKGSLKRVGNSGCRPKILYVITRAQPGGAQAHLLDLLDAFHNQFRLNVAVRIPGAESQRIRR